jgi:hypothetical protein
MSKLSKIALGSVGFWIALAVLHLWLNLGLDPRGVLGILGLKKEGTTEETARFRVGFLPVT